MLPELHIAGFRRQWAAARLNVAPSCQGETHPMWEKQINKDVKGTHWAQTGQSHWEVKVLIWTPPPSILQQLVIWKCAQNTQFGIEAPMAPRTDLCGLEIR